MDENYIENLGQSSEVDEGLWDRLKARAAGYTQAAKNIAGGGSTSMAEAQFNSIFKKFLNQSTKTILDFHRVILPFQDAGKLSPEQKEEVNKIIGLYRDVIYMAHIPLKEANVFTRPFSALGAQASGDPHNIITTYKKLLADYFRSFLKDAGKLNIVPYDYITRKVAARYPEAKNFFDKFKDAVNVDLKTGKDLITPAGAIPTPGAPTPTPAAPTAVPAPTPAPASASPLPTPTPATPPSVAPTPAPAPATPSKPPVVAPAVPVSKPGEVTGAPATGWPKGTSAWAAPTPATPPAKAPAGTVPSEEQKKQVEAAYTLIKKALQNIAANLKSTDASAEAEGRIATSPMLKDIQSYVNRDAWKAQVPFPNNPPVVLKTPSGTMMMKLRYRPDKDTGGHTIQSSYETYDPSGTKIEDTPWQDFMAFTGPDVVKREGGLNTAFDPLQKISEANPQLGKIIAMKEKMGKDPEMESLKQDIAKGLRNVTHVLTSRSAERGLRKLAATPEKESEPVPAVPTEKPSTPPPPIEGPKRKEPMSKPPPDARGRTEQPPPEKPAATPKPAASKPAAKKAAPKAAKPTAKKTVAPAPKPETPAKPEEPKVAPTGSTPSASPAGKSMFGNDEERLKRVNDRWMIPNKLTPLTSIDQMTKFRSALGSDEDPPLYKIQFAHQQATGASPKEKSGKEKIAAKLKPKTTGTLDEIQMKFTDFF